MYKIICTVLNVFLFTTAMASYQKDTSNIHRIIKQSESFWQTNNDSAIFYAQKALNYSKKVNYENGIGEAYLCMAITNLFKGEYEKSALLLKKAEKIFKKVKNGKGLVNVYNTWGGYYYFKGQPEKSIEAYLVCLKFSDSLKNDRLKATYLNNIGGTFYQMRNYPKALDYFEKSLELYEKLKDEAGVAYSSINIGNVYYVTEDYKKAKEYYHFSLSYYEKNPAPYRMAGTYNNLGYIYKSEKDFPKAIEYIRKSIEIREQISDQVGVASSYANLGDISIEKGNYDDALQHNLKALAIAEKVSANEIKKDILYSLTKIYSSIGDYRSAYLRFEEFDTFKDSLINSENQRNITEMETKYETEKKALEIENLKNEKEIDALKDKKEAAEKKVLEEESAAQKQKIILFTVAFILVALLSLLLLRAYRNKQKANIELGQKNQLIEKQKSEVIHQKELVEEKNKEILDSITYAKRLQDAILPPLRIVKEYLPESFILYKPKDIVAGDFYFMEPVKNLIVFAAADCTGHGVPGAMVSVVCSNALHRAVKEFGHREPNLILDKVRELVLATFEKSESEVKDGMDISLCVLDSEKNILHWSGANNPFWLIREGQLTEFKPDKQPIGKSYDPKPFTAHEIQLLQDDTFYIFTDGYEDQFGGEKGKKFKAAKMKELFVSIQSKKMETQRQLINNAFEDWKGELEQVDDVCIIGIRI